MQLLPNIPPSLLKHCISTHPVAVKAVNDQLLNLLLDVVELLLKLLDVGVAGVLLAVVHHRRGRKVGKFRRRHQRHLRGFVSQVARLRIFVAWKRTSRRSQDASRELQSFILEGEV